MPSTGSREADSIGPSTMGVAQIYRYDTVKCIKIDYLSNSSSAIILSLYDQYVDNHI